MKATVETHNDNTVLGFKLDPLNGQKPIVQYVSKESERIELAVDLLKGAFEVLATVGSTQDVLSEMYDTITQLEDMTHG
jgi:hypothetical protein